MPLPFCVSAPAPEMSPAKVTRSVRLKERVAPAATATSPLMLPVVAPLPICSVPAETVVPPSYVLVPVRMSVPRSVFSSPVVPARTAPIVAV